MKRPDDGMNVTDYHDRESGTIPTLHWLGWTVTMAVILAAVYFIFL